MPRIRTPVPFKGDPAKKEPTKKEPPKHNWDKGTGYDEPLPMDPPEKLKAGKPKRRGVPKGVSTSERKTIRHASRYASKPHTVWIREDIWLALKLFAKDQDRSMRSAFEEALYRYLIEEDRVKPSEDLGTDKEITSWKHDK